MGILGSFALIGWLLSVMLPQQTPLAEGAVPSGAAVVERAAARVGVYLGIITLVGVLVVTQLLALTVKRRPVPDRPRGRR